MVVYRRIGEVKEIEIPSIDISEKVEQNKATKKYEDNEALVDREVRRVNGIIAEHIPYEEIDYPTKSNRHFSRKISFRDTLFGVDVEYNVTVYCYKNNDIYVNRVGYDKYRCYLNSGLRVFNVTVSVIGKEMFLSSFTKDVAHEIKHGMYKADIPLLPDYYYELSEKTDKTKIEQAVADVLRYSLLSEMEKYGNEVYCDFLTNCYIPLYDYVLCKSYSVYHTFREEMTLLEEGGNNDELRNLLSKLGYSYEHIVAIGQAVKERMINTMIYYSEKGIKDGPFYPDVCCWRTKQYIYHDLIKFQLDIK